MSLSALAFFAENLVIVAGYTFASLVIGFRRSRAAAGLTRQAWVAGLSFFFLCGSTHLELGLHAILNEPIIGPGGSVDWHMHAVHIPQGISIWAFLWAMRDRPEAALLEGVAAPEPEQ